MASDLIKVEAIVEDVWTVLPEGILCRNSALVKLSYSINNKKYISKNQISVPITFKKGYYMTAWCRKSNPKKVYRYKIFALLNFR